MGLVHGSIQKARENTTLKLEREFGIKNRDFGHYLMSGNLEPRPWTWQERISVEADKQKRRKCEQNLGNRGGRSNKSTHCYAKEFKYSSKTGAPGWLSQLCIRLLILAWVMIVRLSPELLSSLLKSESA